MLDQETYVCVMGLTLVQTKMQCTFSKSVQRFWCFYSVGTDDKLHLAQCAPREQLKGTFQRRQQSFALLRLLLLVTAYLVGSMLSCFLLLVTFDEFEMIWQNS